MVGHQTFTEQIRLLSGKLAWTFYVQSCASIETAIYEHLAIILR